MILLVHFRKFIYFCVYLINSFVNKYKKNISWYTMNKKLHNLFQKDKTFFIRCKQKPVLLWKQKPAEATSFLKVRQEVFYTFVYTLFTSFFIYCKSVFPLSYGEKKILNLESRTFFFSQPFQTSENLWKVIFVSFIN